MKTVNTLQLTKKQELFLKENRQDPITGDIFSIGDTIVFCAECKSAFFQESWEYIGLEHCNQKQTLKTFPSSYILKLKKKVVKNFEQAGIGNRFGAYIFDVIIGIVIAFISNSIFTLLTIDKYTQEFETESYTVGLFAFAIYMVFRDFFTLKGSLGKKIFGLYFTSSKRAESRIYIQLFIRNLIYWIPIITFYLLLLKHEFKESNSVFQVTFIMICFVTVIFFNIMIYPVFFLSSKKSLIDNVLKINLLQKKEL